MKNVAMSTPLKNNTDQCYSFPAVAQHRGYNPLFVTDAVILSTKGEYLILSGRVFTSHLTHFYSMANRQ